MAPTIAELRKERGFATQEQFARAARVSIATIKNIERGAASNPSGRTLRSLSDALDLGIDEIDRAITRKPARRAPRKFKRTA